MIELITHPSLMLIAAIPLLLVARGYARDVVLLLVPAAALYSVWALPEGLVATLHFLHYDLHVIEVDSLRRLFAIVFALMLLAGVLFAMRQASVYELASAFGYGGSAIGVALAGDLITFFVFWEVAAVFSMIIVLCGDTAAARRSAFRYAMIHLLGGVVLQAGIVGWILQSGSILIQPLEATQWTTWLILIGVLTNVAAPPLSAWLPDAYPESSPTGAVFLSAFTTKAAVLALIMLFPGQQILIWIGLYMIFYGIIYALLENDARRILAYSIVNQVGFMVCAVGIGTELALNGAAAHAFAHIIYKGLLMMSAGVVLYRTGLRKCSDLGGLFQSMPLTTICCIVGALSISSFPLTSGFTTKTLISEGAQIERLVPVYYLLAAASAGVFLHAGIKFPWFVFFQKDSGLRPKDAPWNMAAAMLLFSFLCIALGVYPGPLYELLPYPVSYTPYSAAKVVFYLQLLLFSGLAFFLLLPMMKRTRTVTLDFDWLYRSIGRIALSKADAGARRFVNSILARLAEWRKLAEWLVLRVCGPESWIATSWSIGRTTLWIVMLLSVYIAIYYV